MILQFLIIFSEVKSLLTQTKSIVLISFKNFTLLLIVKAGLPGPLLTNLSSVTDTTKMSPSFFAD